MRNHSTFYLLSRITSKEPKDIYWFLHFGLFLQINLSSTINPICWHLSLKVLSRTYLCVSTCNQFEYSHLTSPLTLWGLQRNKSKCHKSISKNFCQKSHLPDRLQCNNLCFPEEELERPGQTVNTQQSGKTNPVFYLVRGRAQHIHAGVHMRVHTQTHTFSLQFGLSLFSLAMASFQITWKQSKGNNEHALTFFPIANVHTQQAVTKPREPDASELVLIPF